MFQLIEHKYYHAKENKDLILPFLTKLAMDPKLSSYFENWTEGTFLLAKDESKTVYGGALLLKQSIKKIHPDLRTYLKKYYPKIKEVWTGMVSLEIDRKLSGREFQRIGKFVYCSLMADLIAFGVQENIHFLCLTTMPSLCGPRIDIHDFWAYAMEANCEHPSNRLFHGILSLDDKNPDVRYLNTKVRERSKV